MNDESRPPEVTRSVDSFRVVQEALRGTAPDSTDDLPVPHQRLIQVAQPTGTATASDRAALTRHVLRSESKKGSASPRLRVPSAENWPDAGLWQRHECQTEPIGHDAFLVRANPWTPEWLPHSGQRPPATAAFKEERRRKFPEVPGDPFLAAMGEEYANYLSMGQQASVRGVLTAPDGATLAINLPTGAGKSLCAQLPSILEGPEESLTVIVVPTVALALDQQDNIRPIVGHDTAYHGGNDSNDAIRKRIREGKQQIVFTSPEGLLAGLAPAVFHAARRGFLQRLVIDEAHIVDQWGNDFRSAFQDLAGMRQGLLDVCEKPFTTLLLSATFTEGTLETLKSLFGRPGPFEQVSAVRLRPEPSYRWTRTDDADARTEHVLEAVRNLPRPLILYVSVRDDAHKWYDRLREEGYERLDMLTGGSSSKHRQDVLDRWSRDETDIVVATSAFGLGIDKKNVRAVVHACLPENINRFYQEVGRGGRDGNASVSLLIAYENASDYGENGRNDDLGRARSINRDRILKPETAFERWIAMFDEAERVPELSRNHVRIPITTSPRLDEYNETNKSWNIRTLILMHRAGFIALHGEPPPRKKEDESEKEIRERLEKYSNHRIIELKTMAPRAEEAFTEAVRKVRSVMYDENDRGLEDMLTLLDGEQCVADILSRVYRVPRDRASNIDDSPVSRSITVTPECGGCPVCREEGEEIAPSPSEDVTMPPRETSIEDLHTSIQNLFRDGSNVYVFYETGDQGRMWSRTVRNAARNSVERGIQRIIAPSHVLDEWREEWRKRRLHVFLDELQDTWPDPTATLDVPELVYLPEENGLASHHLQGSVPRILILPASTTHPKESRHQLRDVCLSAHVRFHTFKSQVSL